MLRCTRKFRTSRQQEKIKYIFSVLRKSIAVIAAVAMMISFMAVIIPTQPAAAQSEPPAVAQSEPPAAAQSEPPAAAQSEPPAVAQSEPPAAQKITVPIKDLAPAIAQLLLSIGGNKTQYLVTVSNESNYTVRYQDICQWRGEGYWPLPSDSLDTDQASAGISTDDEFQFAGVYTTGVPGQSQRTLVFGAYRDDPFIGPSDKTHLIDDVSGLNCSKYDNPERWPWADVRENPQIDLPVTGLPLKIYARHYKTKYPPAPNDVTVYEFRITNN
ncbi:hypothetical protein [Okeania sp. SIO2B3]|uniref:hypothetical protein n=1 Tax=Okeania sp. SIO2B3 TaxID=2607784 RepID=UPI0013C1AE1D|nr:hypothetical protein [Okeania sp. SIO2B3]NET46416.1 hypothetical protein [Okeania sp. SIO2B3]